MVIPQNICALIIAQHEEGHTERRIAKNLQLPKSSVHNIISRHSKTGSTQPYYQGRCARPRRLSLRDEKALCRASVVNPLATASQIRASVGGSVATASLSTIKRALRRHGRLAFRPRKSPALTHAQKLTRLRWCKQFQHWTVEQWKRVSFEIVYKSRHSVV
jgi:transposase